VANVKIADLTVYTNPDATDVLPIVDVGADLTKKVSVGEIVGKITGDVSVATDGTSSITAGTITADLTGNADTATALKTARDIGGVSFDGTANINLPGVNTAGNQDTSGNAATATKLDSARTFEVTGDITGTVSSDLTSGASIATSIASGVIVDADVNASAAIALSKLATGALPTAITVASAQITSLDAAKLFGVADGGSY